VYVFVSPNAFYVALDVAFVASRRKVARSMKVVLSLFIEVKEHESYEIKGLTLLEVIGLPNVDAYESHELQLG